MKAAWYTEKGEASDVIKVGNIEEIEPKDGEIQIKIHYSGINPGDIVKRVYRPGGGMTYPMVIPHSDGSGYVTKVGPNVPAGWIGKKVACFGAQSYRAFGTAAELCCVPETNVVEISDSVSMTQAAQMGIPAITAHRAVHILNNPAGKKILVQGGAGGVAQCAIHFAKRAGAFVIATVTRQEDVEKAVRAGADDVFVLQSKVISMIRERYPEGIDHIIEVSFGRNILMDLELLRNKGSIASYSGTGGVPDIPFTSLLFENITLNFLGSDDFSIEEKRAGMIEAMEALARGWQGLEIGHIFQLEDTAKAHEYIENRTSSKRAMLTLI